MPKAILYYDRLLRKQKTAKYRTEEAKRQARLLRNWKAQTRKNEREGQPMNIKGTGSKSTRRKVERCNVYNLRQGGVILENKKKMSVGDIAKKYG